MSIRTAFLVMSFFLLGLSNSSLGTGNESDDCKLVLYIWADYIDSDLLDDFEAMHNCRVQELNFETDELKSDYLINTNGGEGLDLVIGSPISFRKYVNQGWLMPLTHNLLPNKKNLGERWRRETELTQYGIPYLWGTLGIAYRSDLVEREINSWMDLLKPVESLRKKIIMINDSKDTLGIALKALGYSMNSVEPKQLAEAQTLLLKQRPYVASYGYITLDKNSSLLTGSTWMTPVYNGDGILLSSYNPNIVFVVPQEGTNIWEDHLGILAKSKNRVAAHKFINFLLDGENAAQNAEKLNFASPNEAAKAHLSEEFLNNPNIYPTEELLMKSENYVTLAPRQQRLRNEIFLNIIP